MVQLGYTLMYVSDVKKTMAFYTKAFGLKAGFLHESHQYGEMSTGGTKLGFVHHDTAGSHGFKYQKLDPKKKPQAFEIGLVTPNGSGVKKVYQKAIKAGAKAVCAPKEKPWGQTVAYVRDCNGFLVEICSAMH